MGMFDALRIAASGMAAERLRLDVTSANLANANTAGFKRSDVDFQSSLAAALGGGSEQSVADTSFQTQTDTSSSMQADGNNVDVDQEMAKLSQNALDYQSLVAVAGSRLKMLQTAIGFGQ